jgi:hypothetical protein
MLSPRIRQQGLAADVLAAFVAGFWEGWRASSEMAVIPFALEVRVRREAARQARPQIDLCWRQDGQLVSVGPAL